MTAEPVRTSTVVALPDVHVPLPAQARGIEPHTWNALKTTVWKGASDAMILVAIDYCKAKNYDPLKRPIHIVKTWDNDAGGGRGGYVDSIWDGINSHRITASRTGEYVGQGEPEFGPELTEPINGQPFTFPQWCKVTVYRMKHGHERAFVGKVYWKEAVATGKQGTGPNRMWRKRVYGQLAKCAEAEALRKAFPEELGDTPTLEEANHYGPEHAKDITPERAVTPAPATRMDALEELIGPGPEEPQGDIGGDALNGDEIDPETGEILTPEPPTDWLGLHAKLCDELLTFPAASPGLRDWLLTPAVVDLKQNAPELYADLLGKAKARSKPR